MTNKNVIERHLEFAEYHRTGDGECNAILLAEYANRHNLTAQERFDLSYFFSIVYCCESGIILFNNRDFIRKDPKGAANCLKQDIIFQSDRKYMKMKNNFPKSLIFWSELLQSNPVDKSIKNGVIDLKTAIKRVEQWFMFGRFSAFLFLETYATMMGLKVTDVSIDWQEGDTATSGLLNLYGDDEYANEFDQKGVLRVSVDKMDARLREVANLVKITGGDSNTTKIETSLCAYRKFYKGTRYNGFYLDRMLEELCWYKQERPNYDKLTSELFDMRSVLFPNEFLGEKHGWNGVRKENKKMYMEYGII